MSTSRAPYPTDPQGRAAAPTSWPTVGVRTFLIVLPALLVGFFLATALLPASLLAAHQNLGWLIDIPPGALAGVGLGLLLRPSRDRFAAQVALAAVMTAVVMVALLALAQLRVPGSAAGFNLPAALLGVVVTVVVQSGLAAVLWRSRADR